MSATKSRPGQSELAKRARLILLPVIVGLVLTLSACGSSDGSSGSSDDTASAPVINPTAQMRSVTGGFTKGAVSEAIISAYRIDNAGFKATQLPIAMGMTDAAGMFDLQLDPDEGYLLLETSGGEFIDEADREPDADSRRKITFGTDEGLQVILPPATDFVAITMPAQALLEKARRDADGNGFESFFNEVRLMGMQAHGLDVVTTLPGDPTRPNTTASAATRQYSMMLGGFANLLNRAAIALGLPAPNHAVIEALIADYSDGRIDGMLMDMPVMVSLLQQGTFPVPIDPILNQITVPMPTDLDLNNEISRFRNNNFDAYAATALIVVDESVLSQTAMPPNVPPLAAGDNYAVDEGAVLTVAAPGVLLNDSDADGNNLSTIVASGPQNGQLVLAADGSFEYSHDGGETTSDSFTYTVSDGVGGTATGTVTITINPINDSPVAADENYSVDEEATLTIPAPGVLGNDVDAELDPLTATIAASPVNGQLSLEMDGSFVYTHDGSETIQDSFSYTVSDGQATDTATVTITINPVNDPPVAAADSYSLDEMATLTIAAPGVLGNDTDAESDPLTAALTTPPVNGSLMLLADGSFVYTHDGSETTQDSFTYEVSDGQGGSATAAIMLIINPINDPPVAADDSYSVDEEATLTIPAPGVLGNDVDAESDPLTAMIDASPVNGQLSLAMDGSFVYTHDGSETTQDTFSYIVSDGQATDTATVTITINPINDPPVAADDSYSVDEEATLTIPAPGVLGNDVDAESDPLTATIDASPVNGQLSLAMDGSFVYTHDGSETTQDTFSYIVSDGQATDTATVTITINPINDPPVAADDSYSVDEGQTLTIDVPGVLDNDTDAENDTLTAILVTDVSNGFLTLQPTGDFSYEHGCPAQPDSFTYHAFDGTDNSADVTVSIDVVLGPDTDGDGLRDGEETILDTDPGNPDTDGDGISDFDEVNADGDRCTISATDTNPLNPDTDGDDVGDGLELFWGTNPTVADEVLHVSADTGDDQMDGSSWATAVQSNFAVRAALIGPSMPNYVLYDSGVYSNLFLIDFLTISPVFHLIGSMGPGIFQPQMPLTTIFNADGSTAAHFSDIPEASLQHVILENGDGSSLAGGVDVRQFSRVTVLNCEIRNNSNGGFFVEDGSNLAIIDTLVSGNSSGAGLSAAGGLAQGDLIVENTVFANNDSIDGIGGTLQVDSSLEVSISGSKFLSNFGSGIEVRRSNGLTTLFNNLIVGNVSEAPGGGITAIPQSTSDLTHLDMRQNTIAYNQSFSTGGGYAGRNGCGSTASVIDGNIIFFNDDTNPGPQGLDDNFFIEQAFGPVCGPDARAVFQGLVDDMTDTLVDFESVASGTRLTTQIPGITFASISDTNGNPAGPFHVQVSSAFPTEGNTIVGSPCGGCVDDGRVRYEMVFETPQRRVGLQRIWNSFTVTRFFDIQDNLLHEFKDFNYSFVGYVAQSADPNAWVKRIEIDGQLDGVTRQVGYSDDLYFGTADVPVIFGLGQNLTLTSNDVEGGPVGDNGIAVDPQFESGFYLNQASSPAVDAHTSQADQTYPNGETTDPNGAADSGQTDLGFHHFGGINLIADAAGPNQTVPGSQRIEFGLTEGPDFLLVGPGQLIGVCIGAASTWPNATLFSNTNLDPVGVCASVLARDLGNGLYAVDLSGDNQTSGIVELDVYVNGAASPLTFTVTINANPLESDGDGLSDATDN